MKNQVWHPTKLQMGNYNKAYGVNKYKIKIVLVHCNYKLSILS